ncbi:hypothetical protein CsSME_00018199 [Camellia sinensis var. sinensis]
MELCYSGAATTTSTTPTFLQLKPSLVSLSLSNTLVQLNTTKNNTLFIPHKLSTSSRQFSLLQPQSSRLSTRFSASSSSTAYDTVQDQLPADVEVTETQEPNSRIRLSVEVPPAVCEDCYKRVMNEFMKQSKVPGFRPGKKVPESILLSYVGKQNARKATIESVLKRTLPHAMSSVTGRALKDSIRIVTKFSDMEETYSSLNSLRYDIIVDVAPEVKWIPEGGYKNLKIVVQIDSEIDAHKASEQELKRRHKSLGLLRIVTDRGLQVECKELFYRDLPELDDSIADKLLPGCTTLEQVKESLLQKCLEVEQTAKEQATDNAILDQLRKMIEVDIPQSLVEEQGRQFYGAKLLEIQANMKLNEQQLASLSSPRAVNEYLENQKENITNIIKQNLAVGDIFKRENLQFPTEELVKEVENSIAEFKRHKQDYDEERVKEQVQEILEGAKVLEWLREHAEIEYTTR